MVMLKYLSTLKHGGIDAIVPAAIFNGRKKSCRSTTRRQSERRLLVQEDRGQMKIRQLATLTSTSLPGQAPPRSLRIIRLLPIFALALVAMLLPAVAMPSGAEAAKELTIDNIPIGKSVTVGEAGRIGKVKASGIAAKRIRFSIEGHEGFSIKKKKGIINYDGSAVSGESVTLTVTASDNKDKIGSVSAHVVVAVALPQQQQQQQQGQGSENPVEPEPTPEPSNDLVISEPIIGFSITRGTAQQDAGYVNANQQGVRFILEPKARKFFSIDGDGHISYNGGDIDEGAFSFIVQASWNGQVVESTVNVTVNSGQAAQNNEPPKQQQRVTNRPSNPDCLICTARYKDRSNDLLPWIYTSVDPEKEIAEARKWWDKCRDTKEGYAIQRRIDTYGQYGSR